MRKARSAPGGESPAAAPRTRGPQRLAPTPRPEEKPMDLKQGMVIKVITSADRLFKGKVVEIHPDGWFVMVQELGDRVQVNPAHVVAIEE
jgi:hypothetical protein